MTVCIPRVMYVGHTARLSGGEIALERLLAALGPHVRPLVVLAEEGPLVDRLVAREIEVRVLPMPERLRSMPRSSVKSPIKILSVVVQFLKYVVRLALLIRRERVDIVHTNTLKAGYYGCIAARLAGRPAIWHLRDRVAPDYLPELVVRATRLALAIFPHRIICNSASTMSTITNKKSSSVYRRSVVIASAIFDAAHGDSDIGEQRRRPPGSGLAIAMVGRFAPWKGQDVALRAFSEAALPSDSRLAFIGDALFGETAFLEEVKAQVVELRIADRVTFTGFVERVADELLAFDVLVHASVIPEPFGQVIVEGMSAGCGVVATRGGGPSEIVTDRVNGRLYEPGNWRELAGILEELQRDPRQLQSLSAAARLRAKDFSGAAIAPAVLRVYASVLGRASGLS
jgi:glycosyltransferase involved in cell wall biosynthesis